MSKSTLTRAVSTSTPSSRSTLLIERRTTLLDFLCMRHNGGEDEEYESNGAVLYDCMSGFVSSDSEDDDETKYSRDVRHHMQIATEQTTPSRSSFSNTSLGKNHIDCYNELNYHPKRMVNDDDFIGNENDVLENEILGLQLPVVLPNEIDQASVLRAAYEGSEEIDRQGDDRYRPLPPSALESEILDAQNVDPDSLGFEVKPRGNEGSFILKSEGKVSLSLPRDNTLSRCEETHPKKGGKKDVFVGEIGKGVEEVKDEELVEFEGVLKDCYDDGVILNENVNKQGMISKNKLLREQVQSENEEGKFSEPNKTIKLEEKTDVGEGIEKLSMDDNAVVTRQCENTGDTENKIKESEESKVIKPVTMGFVGSVVKRKDGIIYETEDIDGAKGVISLAIEERSDTAASKLVRDSGNVGHENDVIYLEKEILNDEEFDMEKKEQIVVVKGAKDEDYREKEKLNSAVMGKSEYPKVESVQNEEIEVSDHGMTERDILKPKFEIEEVNRALSGSQVDDDEVNLTMIPTYAKDFAEEKSDEKKLVEEGIGKEENETVDALASSFSKNYARIDGDINGSGIVDDIDLVEFVRAEADDKPDAYSLIFRPETYLKTHNATESEFDFDYIQRDDEDSELVQKCSFDEITASRLQHKTILSASSSLLGNLEITKRQIGSIDDLEYNPINEEKTLLRSDLEVCEHAQHDNEDNNCIVVSQTSSDEKGVLYGGITNSEKRTKFVEITVAQYPHEASDHTEYLSSNKETGESLEIAESENRAPAPNGPGSVIEHSFSVLDSLKVTRQGVDDALTIALVKYHNSEKNENGAANLQQSTSYNEECSNKSIPQHGVRRNSYGSIDQVKSSRKKEFSFTKGDVLRENVLFKENRQKSLFLSKPQSTVDATIRTISPQYTRSILSNSSHTKRKSPSRSPKNSIYTVSSFETTASHLSVEESITADAADKEKAVQLLVSQMMRK